MAVLEALTAATQITQVLKASLAVAKKVEDVDLIGKIADAQMQVADLKNALVDLQEVNRELKARVAELEDHAKIAGELTYRQPAYYREFGDKEDGPFCARCWDVDKRLVRMMVHRNTYQGRTQTGYTCNECARQRNAGR